MDVSVALYDTNKSFLKAYELAVNPLIFVADNCDYTTGIPIQD